MPVDKFGIRFLYPSKASGFFYEQSDDVLDDNNFNGEGDVVDSANGEWTFETSGPTSVQIFKNSDSANSIGGCNMNFADTLARGFAYKIDDPRDIELSFAIKFISSSSDNGFAIEGPTGRHSGDGCCQGFAYKADIRYREDPPTFRFRKEMWHVSNHTDPKTGTFTHPDFDFQLLGHSNYVGFKYIHYVKKDGVSSGRDSVVLELWGNPDIDADKDNWILIKRTEDKGGWGDDGGQCNGDDDQIGAWSNSNFRLKSNDSDGVFQFKYLSLREIDPSEDFDSTPDNPENPVQPETPTRLTGTFILQRDINAVPKTACDPSGIKLFYDLLRDDEKVLSDSTTWDNITKIAASARNNTSILIGKVPKQLNVNLKKSGSPGATPVISARIWDADDNIKSTSVTTKLPSDLTTSFVQTIFDFSANTYTMQKGDKIGVEWEGTDDTNYVIVGIRRLDIIDSDNTCCAFFTADNDKWSNVTGFDAGFKIWD